MNTIKHHFDQQELDRRITNELGFYAVRDTTPRLLGALHKISHGNMTWFLMEVAEKVMAGYVHRTESPVITSYPEYSAYYTKPQHLQAIDKAVIAEQIEAQYRAELKLAYDQHLELIVQETLQREERAEQKKLDAARTRKVEAARKEAVAALGEFQ